MDSTLRNFAVFINSSVSTYKSTEKSVVSIPFNGNLSTHDPSKLLRVAVSQFQFTNSVYNVDTTNNKLTVCAQFAEGRGYTSANFVGAQQQQFLRSRLWQTWDIEIPVGSYNTQQLANLLSEQSADVTPEKTSALENRVGYESIAQRFQYAAQGNPINVPATETYQNCFIGFGASSFDATDPVLTPGVTTVDNGSKVVFQSADIPHMTQYGVDINTPCVNILANANSISNAGSLDRPYVYKAIHLLYNAQSAPLLKMIGFFNIDTIPATTIDGYCDNGGNYTPMSGYSLFFRARTLYDEATTAASLNVTWYQFVASPVRSNNIQLAFVPQFLTTPVQGSGWVYGGQVGDKSQRFFIKSKKDGALTTYVSYEPGLYVQGGGFTSPFPFISNKISHEFFASYTNGDTFITISEVDWTANNGYSLVVGMPLQLTNSGDIAVYYDAVPANGYGLIIENITFVPGNDAQLFLNQMPTFGGNFANETWVAFDYTLSIGQSVTIIVTDPPPVVGDVFWNTLYAGFLLTYEQLSAIPSELRPNTLTNLEGLSEVHVHCAQLRTTFLSSTIGQPLCPSDTICVVPVNEPFGSKVTYNPPIALEAYLSNTNIVSLDIRLTNSNNQELNFHGCDWSMVLKCDEVDAMSPSDMASAGLLSTPYQKQVSVLEGTGLQEVRAKRGRLPHGFYDSNKKHNSEPFNQYSIS